MFTIFSSLRCPLKIFDSLFSFKLLPVFALVMTTMPTISNAMEEETVKSYKVRLPSAFTRQQKIQGIYAVEEGEDLLIFNAEKNQGLMLGVQFQPSKVKQSFDETHNFIVKRYFYQGIPHIRAIGFSNKIEQALGNFSLKPGEVITVIVKPYPKNRHKDKVIAFAPEDMHADEAEAAIKANTFSYLFKTDGSFDMPRFQSEGHTKSFYPHELLAQPYNCTREDIIKSGYREDELLESGFTDNEISPHFAKQSLKFLEGLISHGLPQERLSHAKQQILKSCINAQLTNKQIFDLGFRRAEIRETQNFVHSDTFPREEIDELIHEFNMPFDELEINIIDTVNSKNEKENSQTITVKNHKKKTNINGMHPWLLKKNGRNKPSKPFLNIKLINHPLKEKNR